MGGLCHYFLEGKLRKAQGQKVLKDFEFESRRLSPSLGLKEKDLGERMLKAMLKRTCLQGL